MLMTVSSRAKMQVVTVINNTGCVNAVYCGMIYALRKMELSFVRGVILKERLQKTIILKILNI